MHVWMADTGLQIYFNPGKQGANQHPPAAGQCTWLDRGVRRGEGKELDWERPGWRINTSLDFNSRGQITDVMAVGKRAKAFKYLVNSVLQGRTFEVRARSFHGLLKVTHVGP